MRIDTDQKELDLIKQYQQQPNDKIALYFFDKYKEYALNIIAGKINKRFSSIPLDRGDFYNSVWVSVKNALKEYDQSKGKNFFNFVVGKSYFHGIKEAAKFLKNSHIILNNAYSYDNIVDNKKYAKFKNLGNVNLVSYSQLTKNFINSVIEFNNKFKDKDVKRVIYLKSLGYSSSEISKKTRIPLHNVKRIMSLACGIAKKLYE